MKYVAGVAMALVVGVVVLSNARVVAAAQVDVPLSFFEEQLSSGNVKSVDVEHDRLAGELVAPRTWNGRSVGAFQTTLPEGTTSQWSFSQWLLANRRDAIVKSETRTACC
jgi:hypothetical protein